MFDRRVPGDSYRELREKRMSGKELTPFEKLINRPEDEFFEDLEHTSPSQHGSKIQHLFLSGTDIFKDQLGTQEGSREAVETILNSWTAERLILDRLYNAEILRLASHPDSCLEDLQAIFDKKRPNEEAIISILSSRKRLLTLPGVSFTQVNLTSGPQQVNNCATGMRKPKGEIQ